MTLSKKLNKFKSVQAVNLALLPKKYLETFLIVVKCTSTENWRYQATKFWQPVFQNFYFTIKKSFYYFFVYWMIYYVTLN